MKVDLRKEISEDDIRTNLRNTEDIIQLPVVAPTNRVQMRLLETAYTDIFSPYSNPRKPGWLKSVKMERCCAKSCVIAPVVPVGTRQSFTEEFEEAVVIGEEKKFIKKYVRVTLPARRRCRRKKARKERTKTHTYFIYDWQVCCKGFIKILGISKKYLRRVLEY